MTSVSVLAYRNKIVSIVENKQAEPPTVVVTISDVENNTSETALLDSAGAVSLGLTANNAGLSIKKLEETYRQTVANMTLELDRQIEGEESWTN